MERLKQKGAGERDAADRGGQWRAPIKRKPGGSAEHRKV